MAISFYKSSHRAAFYLVGLLPLVYTSVIGAEVGFTQAVVRTGVATTGSPGPGIRLEAPPLINGQILSETEIRKEIEKKTTEALQGLHTEAIVQGAPGETSPAIAIKAILAGVPIGYGTLLKTSNAVNPGPQVGENDPRVVDFSEQTRIEQIISLGGNFLPVRFLEVGAQVSKPVARVAVRYNPLPEAGIATGFMVSPSLFMTNNHVIPNKTRAQKLVLDFNYQYSLDGGTIMAPTLYELDPDSFFYTNPSLDFTIVRVKTRRSVPTTATGAATELRPGDEFGFIRIDDSFYYSVGQLANVIQHPQGRPKEIALHENKLVSLYENVIRYTTDTEPGSSGSPVFNNSWQLISLHHAAGDQDPSTGKYVNNEGIRIDKIVKDLRVPNNVQLEILKELGL